MPELRRELSFWRMLNSKENKGILMSDFSKMNQSQIQAVNHGEGPLLLLAGPGSGKTFTITNRILKLLNQGVSPGEILVITFTKEAALSMQRRFADRVAPHVYPVNFGTFHSVFYQILRESNVVKSSKLLSDSEKKSLLLPILFKYCNPGEDMSLLREDTIKMLSAFSFYKNTANLNGATAKCPEQWREDFCEIYKAYQTVVAQEGRLDFDDMLYQCKQLLERDAYARKRWQERFPHILIDEFQDINPIQYEIIKLLSGKPHNIFAVGDDDQSIYGFRGSEPDCMRRFVEEFQAKQLLLDVNYRSTPEIVQASLAVISENRNRFEKELRSSEEISGDDAKNNKVILRDFQENKAEYDYLIQRLKDTLAAEEHSTCAVLFRTNQYMQSFAVWLQQAEIPYEMKEKQASIYEHIVVQDVMAYLQLGKGMGSREQLLKIINKPSRYIKREAVLVKDGKPNFVAMREVYRKPWVEESERRRFLDSITTLEQHFRSLEKLSNASAITYILKALGYEEHLKRQAGKSDKLEEWRRLLDWLKADASKFRNLKEWIDFQRDYGENLRVGKHSGEDSRIAKGYTGKDMKTENKAVQNGQQPRIHLMTVHAAKGLEFEHVWIPDCNERVFPYGRMPDEKTVEEERRVFYVAMTRAKKSLELLYLTGTRERPRQPSVFLNPLYSSPSINSSNSQLSRYSSNASATFSYSASSAMYSNTGSSLGSSGFSLYP